MPARFGPIPTDIWFCRACGRGLRSVEGHDPIRYCYGCGAFRSCENTHEKDPGNGSLFGAHGWWACPSPKVEVEFLIDYRYDPWTGERFTPKALPDFEGVSLEEIQLGQVNALLGSLAC